MTRLQVRSLTAGGLALAASALLGCHDSSGPSSTIVATENTVGEAVHADVVMRDRFGAPILPGSTEPYSPRQTCGGCHDMNHMSNGYHFQQGRTDVNGNMIVRDNFFNDGRDYVRSPGMYGKW